MGTLLVVFREPGIEIGLQLLERPIDLLPECHAIELIQQGLVEAFTAPAGLGRRGLRPSVIKALHGQIQLIGMALGGPAVLRPPVGQHPGERNRMGLEKRQHAIVQQMGRRDRRRPVIELGQSHLAVGIDSPSADRPRRRCRAASLIPTPRPWS